MISEEKNSDLAQRFAIFRKSDRVVLFTKAKDSPDDVVLALRIFLIAQAKSKHIESYRIETVGEWLGLNLPELSEQFSTIAQNLAKMPPEKISKIRPQQWTSPNVFDCFTTGLHLGKAQIKKTLEPLARIRYDQVDP